jgi:predicted lipid-binding transport protein (Tim44 family)
MLTGFVLGGLLGSLLFGGMGHAASIGLLDVLLIAGGVFLLASLLRRRRQEPRPAYAYPGTAAPGGVAPDEYATAPAGGVTPEAPDDLERGLRHIRAMDPAFDAAAVAEMAAGAFLEVQRAVTARDVGPLVDRLTPEMRGTLQEQCDRLRAARQTNRLERIRIDRAEVTEAWQEGGWDFVTVLLAGSMLDYTVRDATGEVVAGSSVVPEAFEEYWTFTRPVGPRPWKLAAIQTG